MRAAILREYGGVPETVEDWPEPDGDTVEVLAAGLNPVDLRIASGTFYGGAPPLPYVPGGEGVGRVDGRRVYFTGSGTFAERAVGNPSSYAVVPEGLEDALAVACGTAGTTAWMALERAQIRKGDSVLILGATGAVGTFGVQAARLLGAGCVVAAARNAEGLARCKEVGADATISLDADPDTLVAQIVAACGGDGPNVVLDPLWGSAVEAAAEAAAHGARIVQLGESAGAQASFTSATVRGKELAILGFTLVRADPDARRGATERLLRHVAYGAIRIETEAVPLTDVATAWRRQAESPNVKLVVVP
jgi:NADPH2:quinone reductase